MSHLEKYQVRLEDITGKEERMTIKEAERIIDFFLARVFAERHGMDGKFCEKDFQSVEDSVFFLVNEAKKIRQSRCSRCDSEINRSTK